MNSASFVALAQNSFFANPNTSGMFLNAKTDAVLPSQRAYHDGIVAVTLDTLVHRKVDPKVSHLYVHPPVKGKDATVAYRAQFEAGYMAALRRSAF